MPPRYVYEIMDGTPRLVAGWRYTQRVYSGEDIVVVEKFYDVFVFLETLRTKIFALDVRGGTMLKYLLIRCNGEETFINDR